MAHTRLWRDAAGVEGLPMTLVISMVVLAITLPLIFGSLRSYDRARTDTELSAEIDRLVNTVQTVYVSGPGNSAVVEFSAAGGSMTGIDYVRFGDAPGGNLTSTVRYKLQGQDERILAVMSPNVPMSGGDSAFEIFSGTYSISVKCIVNENSKAMVFMSFAL